MEQLTLFGMGSSTEKQTAAAPKAQPKANAKKQKKTQVNNPKPVLPAVCEKLAQLNEQNSTFEDLVFQFAELKKSPASLTGVFGAYQHFHHEATAYRVIGNTVYSDDISKYKNLMDNLMLASSRTSERRYTSCGCHPLTDNRMGLVYISEDGNVWTSKLEFVSTENFGELSYLTGGKQAWSTCTVKEFRIEKWRLTNRLFVKEGHYFLYLNAQSDLKDILEKTNPYGAVFFKNYRPELGLMAPQLEQLYKADYDIAQYVIDMWSAGVLEQSAADKFNRLCTRGNSLKTIFKTSKVVYKTLKNEKNLEIWDVYRKMDKMGKLTQDQVQRCYDCGFRERELNAVNQILNARYNGKKVFTFDSLLNYLNRLDLYEAISNEQAFMLLPDYLRMCSVLNMEPRVDGDSLAREHNIAARLCREQRAAKEPANFAKACAEMAANNYEENVFFVRAITSYDDLFDEAKQQHNCLASYGSIIADKKELVYVMREKANPDKSLITVSLNPQQTQIRQKFMSYNRAIHNKAQTEFLERWLKMVKARNHKGYASIQELQQHVTQTLV